MAERHESDLEKAGWTEKDSNAAWAEGWAIWDCDGSDNGPWQICQVDDPDGCDCEGLPDPYPFLSDTGVWEFIVGERTELHLHALNVIRTINPKEYDAILKWCVEKGVIQGE